MLRYLYLLMLRNLYIFCLISRQNLLSHERVHEKQRALNAQTEALEIHQKIAEHIQAEVCEEIFDSYFIVTCK